MLTKLKYHNDTIMQLALPVIAVINDLLRLLNKIILAL